MRLLYRPGNRLGQSASRWIHVPWNDWTEQDFRTPASIAHTTRVITYTYDPLNRLTNADYSTGESFAYQYNAVGNRTVMTDAGGVTTYTYDAANRLTSVGGVSYTWDDRGNLTNDGTFTYTYSAAGRMVQVEGVTVTLVYTYNANGLRVAQSVDGDVTNFAWDWASGIPEMLSEGGNLYLVGHETLGQWDGSEWVYYLPDALGSIRQESDGTGAVTDAREWTPFGMEVGMVRAGLGYAGEHWDGDAELLYLRARWYDPTTDRFLARDPFPGLQTWPQSQNAYPYTANNPILRVDPSGEVCLPCLGLGLAALLAFASCSETPPYVCHPIPPQFTPQVNLPVIYSQLTDAVLDTAIPDPRAGDFARLACGPTSMAMVLEYYVARGATLPNSEEPHPSAVVAAAFRGSLTPGGRRTYWDLTRGGVAAGNMVLMFREVYGFTSTGSKGLNLTTLQEAIKSSVPLIVGVSRVGGDSPDLESGEGHAVVVVGLSQDNQWVILADPWGGQMKQCRFDLIDDAHYIRAEP